MRTQSNYPKKRKNGKKELIKNIIEKPNRKLGMLTVQSGPVLVRSSISPIGPSVLGPICRSGPIGPIDQSY